MGKVVLDITMSLDGFIAGSNVDCKQPMGEGGLRLHDWLFDSRTDIDARILEEILGNSGAVIIGGRTYKVAIEEAWGGVSPFTIPAFVLSTVVPEHVKAGFTFVTDGIESALNQAKVVAAEKNVWVMGGANIIQQYIKAALFDELHIHIAHVLLVSGTRLFEHIGNETIELENSDAIKSRGAVHLKFRRATKHK